MGSGCPSSCKLSKDVADRAAVEAGLTVTTSKHVEGSWSWLSDRELHWRPKKYWPADTDVTVTVHLKGVQAPARACGAPRTAPSPSGSGSSTMSTVDITTHTMTVEPRRCQVVRTIPITTGKDGFRTRNGIKVIVSKERTRVMDATTIDIPKDSPDYYRLEVEYAMRLTWSGEFLHAAPWSVGAPGSRERLPRLHRHVARRRRVALRPVQGRRRRALHRLDPAARVRQRLDGLERQLVGLDRRQRPLRACGRPC